MSILAEVQKVYFTVACPGYRGWVIELTKFTITKIFIVFTRSNCFKYICCLVLICLLIIFI